MTADGAGAPRGTPEGSGPEGGGPGVPRLHVVAPDDAAERPGFGEAARSLLEEGAGDLALHLRLERASGRRIHELTERLARAAGETGGWCVVNERVDVALTARAQAVQLGGGALPTDRARALLPAGTAIGRSVHGREEGEEATRDGANFLLLGTIFRSASHPDLEGRGPGLVEACADLGPPLVAIGGMTPGRVAAVRAAGAHGVATSSGVWGGGEPLEAVRRFLEALALGG